VIVTVAPVLPLVGVKLVIVGVLVFVAPVTVKLFALVAVLAVTRVGGRGHVDLPGLPVLRNDRGDPRR